MKSKTKHYILIILLICQVLILIIEALGFNSISFSFVFFNLVLFIFVYFAVSERKKSYFKVLPKISQNSEVVVYKEGSVEEENTQKNVFVRSLEILLIIILTFIFIQLIL